jgi:triosephosphate isomerase
LESKKRDIAMRITVNVCRFILAFTFIFSGFVKAVDPIGFQYKIDDYLEAFGIGTLLPDVFSLFMGIALSVAEFTVGVCLLLGIRRNMATTLVLLMMCIMTPLTLYLAIFNPVPDCGCFGEAVTLTNWQTFGKNIILLASAIIVFTRRQLIIAFISQKTEWIVSLYALTYITIFSFYCLHHLPVFDFRPYKIGTDIAKAMEDDPSKLSKFRTTFIMEKDGVRQEFSEDNFPDSTWHYVDRRTEVIEKGSESAVSDFAIQLCPTGEDITDIVLGNPDYTFLLIAPRLDKANDSYIDLINEIYDYSVENDYSFYCLTAAGQTDREMWCDATGAEYQFANTDETVLKTIVRSNPGLVLMKEGVILNKWSDRDLPDEYALTDRLENLKLGQQKEVSRLKTTGKLCLWFFIPLLLVLWLDIKLKWKEPNIEIHKFNHLKSNKMRKNIVAGNWKMNKTLQEGIALAKELNEVLTADKPNCDVIICTPFIHLASVTPIVDASIIGVGAENCADKEQGAFTGEVSAAMVASTGAKYVILGHSERRAYYGETVEILKEKVKLALANGLTPIFCIGEVLEEREANKQNEVVAAQLASVFDLSAEDFGKIILAYEPVWAIGTGKTATAAQAQEIHAFIRSLIVEKYGKEVAENTSILYGGSCKPSNAKELFANPDVDGGLIGGAALKAADFKGIIDAFKA